MANIKGQIRRNIKNEKQNQENRKSRSKLRTMIKKCLDSIKGGSSMDPKLLNETISYTDSCESKGLIKKNKASRIKSNLMTKNNIKTNN